MKGHEIDPCGEPRRRGGRNVCGVINTRPEIGGIPGGGVTGKGAQTNKDTQTLHVQALEGQGIYTSGGPNTTTAVH